MNTKPDLYRDLLNSDLIQSKILDNSYAGKLYAALCNIKWLNKETLYKPDPKSIRDDSDYWTCSWRYAGEIVSTLRKKAGDPEATDYMDWYCNGGEGSVDYEIQEDLYSLGWMWQYY